MPATFADPDALADAIIAKVGRKIVLGLPLGLGKANHVANALYRRAVRVSMIDLMVYRNASPSLLHGTLYDWRQTQFSAQFALPFTYPSESLPNGASEMEQYFDLTPTHFYDSQGSKVWTVKSVITTEYEYGISNKLELGLYLELSNDPSTQGLSSTPPMTFDGIKQYSNRWLHGVPRSVDGGAALGFPP